jgi:hypothetical protein
MGTTAHVDWLRMALIQKQCHFAQNLRGEHLRESESCRPRAEEL